MRSLTINLPDDLAARIEAEAVKQKISVSDVVRKHLNVPHSHNARGELFEAITDVVRRAVTQPPLGAERSPDNNALFDAITKVVRSAEELDAERLSGEDAPPHVVLQADPLHDANPLSDAEGLIQADTLSETTKDDPSTGLKRRRQPPR